MGATGGDCGDEAQQTKVEENVLGLDGSRATVHSEVGGADRDVLDERVDEGVQEVLGALREVVCAVHLAQQLHQPVGAKTPEPQGGETQHQP